MKKLLLLAFVLNLCPLVEGPAQSQTPSRKRPEFSSHSKRARFARPPHPQFEEMEVDSLKNAAPRHSVQSFQSGEMQILSGGVQAAWVARHDEPGSSYSYDYAQTMAVDAAGNIYVTGYSQSFGNSQDYVTVKYNAAGLQQWTARYHGPGRPVDLAVDGAGNVYVMGTSGTVKYNSAGTQEWVVNKSGNALAVDGGGNVYVTGSSWNSTNQDYTTVKYNSAGTREWVAIYNGPENNHDVASTLVVDGAGNIYVTGRSWNGKNSDYATIKYNSAGKKQWVVTYNRSDSDYPIALAVDGAGNVYVTGNSGTIKYNSAGTQEWVANKSGNALAVDGAGNVYVTGDNWGYGSFDYATVKYNSGGTQQWVATYNGPGNGHDNAVALGVDTAGNIYVTGHSGKGDMGSSDYATVKYNSAGTQEWVKTYNGPGTWDDYAVALAVDAAGNVYVTGSSAGSCTAWDYATIKYDAFGVEQWVTRQDESGSDDNFATAMTNDGSGNIYVTGYAGSIHGCSQYVTVKYDAAGVQQWIARYKGPANGPHHAIAIAVDGAGNIYVTGSSWNGISSDYVTIKYNTSGQEHWVARYNGPGNDDDEAKALAVDGAGNVYVTGSSWDDDESYDYTTVKYNSTGQKQWVARYNGPNGWGEASALAVDGAGNVFVTGSIVGSGTDLDFATIKYNSAGKKQWDVRYNGPENDDDTASALAVDRHGNVYVAGTTVMQYAEGDDDVYADQAYATIKYNSVGQQQWVAHHNSNEPNWYDTESVSALAVDGDGHVYVTGTIDEDIWEDHDLAYATVKYNAAGQRQWAARYNAPDNDFSIARDLAVDGAGNVYVTGSSGDYDKRRKDYATVKYNSAGQQQWVARYNRPGDGASALVVDARGNVYVTGSNVGVKTGSDFVTIKYTQNPIADAGPDKTICAGGSVQIGGSPTGSNGSGGPYVFSWTPTTGLNTSAVPNPIASPVTSTTYTVTVTEPATGLSATDDVIVTVPATGWSVAHIVDVDDVIFGINQGATTDAAPRNNRGLALSPDERFLYLSYNMSFNKRVVRKIDLSVSDPANNHSAVVAQLKLPPGSQPARDIATDDRGRVYLALGTKIEVYNSNLQAPPLHTISGFTACEGVAVRRESNGALAVYATDRLDKTLERFVLVAGDGETIASSNRTGLDGDGEVGITGLSRPRGLDIASNGTVWIADLGKSKVYRINPAGKIVDSTGVRSPMDIAIDEARGEVYVSQYTLRTLKVLNLNTGKIKRTLTPPAADLNVDLDGETGSGALCGIDVGSCQRVFVANEQGRSLLTGNPLDSPFSNVSDNNDVKAADTDPVLVVTGSGLAKESEVEDPEVASNQLSVTSYQLAQNYPNPFNPSTTINFALPEAAEVSLKIYDIAGQMVQTLVDGVVQAGRHQVVWDGTNQYGVLVASGVYFYQLRAGEFKQVRKMSLVR